MEGKVAGVDDDEFLESMMKQQHKLEENQSKSKSRKNPGKTEVVERCNHHHAKFLNEASSDWRG